MTLAVYGKHPAKGDFLEHGVPAVLKPLLEGWLDATMAQARAALGADWQAVWPTAPMLRFWLGEGIWGTPVAGVMAPAQDRVGRRFPMVLLALGDAGSALPPPVTDADQSWYDAACAHLTAALARQVLCDPSDLLIGAPEVAQDDPMPGPSAFWAVRPGADVGHLLTDIALTDHRRASEGRSYWWVAGSPEAEETDESPPLAAPEVDTLVQPPPEGRTNALAEVHEPDLPVCDPWGLSDLPEPDDSPFAAAPSALSLFAPPEPGRAEVIEAMPPADAPAAPRLLWSQVWAGQGLPSGDVLAWFFRGHAGND
jgi:type VI secretion system protein ImpM